MGEEQEQKFHQLTEEPVSRVISHLAVPCAATLPLALWAWCFP